MSTSTHLTEVEHCYLINYKKNSSQGTWKTMQGTWRTGGKGCGRPNTDTPRLKQNFNQLFIFLGKTFKVLIKVECLSFQSVGTEFSDLEYIPRYGPPKFCLYQFMWVEDTKINLSSLANLVEDNRHPLGTWPG